MDDAANAVVGTGLDLGAGLPVRQEPILALLGVGTCHVITGVTDKAASGCRLLRLAEDTA